MTLSAGATAQPPQRWILVATTNAGKMREIDGILAGLPLTVVDLSAFPNIAEPEETGTTFADNARLKALYYHHATSVPSVADDSGLEIAALDGLPGIHSARWEGTDYAVKFRKIYELLDERNARRSPARFVCRVALADYGRIIFESEGVIEGQIADEPRGDKGFGYDPIFYYPPLGRTTAELDRDLKATVSHRGKAFAELRRFLQGT
ncbi:MAG TPA: RdgB/HAM1 family non-canonical purine NTP pyrophosphatase [Vicinamibacterales bacterium]|nr:RdgB/HAM1 family non-canonical purine NTP pyrophosphatase [Vicinamibacterales bacterium]